MLNYEQFSKRLPTQNPLTHKTVKLHRQDLFVFIKQKLHCSQFYLPLYNISGVCELKTRKQCKALRTGKLREGDFMKSCFGFFFLLFILHIN